MEKYLTMKPGKYWTLPKNQKEKLPQFLTSDAFYATVKYDGEWSRSVITSDSVIMQSRNISTATGDYGLQGPKVPHITDELKEFTDCVFVGELCYSDISRTSKDVGSIMRSKEGLALTKQREEANRLHYKIFDILCYNGEPYEDKPAIERRNKLEEIFNQRTFKYISPATRSDNGEKLLQDVLAAGGEGIMLIKKDLPYKQGNKQAWHSIKVKKELKEIEAPVVGLLEAEQFYQGTSTSEFIIDGKEVTKNFYHGWPAGVIVEMNGKEVSISSGVTDDDKEYLKNKSDDDYVVAVFSGMEITENGSVRHPYLIRLRTDLDKE